MRRAETSHSLSSRNDVPSNVLITGGAGFIGTNLADRLASAGSSVTIYDNLSRAGVTRNLTWLRDRHGDRIRLEKADVRDAARLKSAVSYADRIFHLAAQVAVTTSLTDPRHDYEVNLGGTINLLEAIRVQDTPPPLVFTSTNKVYGALEDFKLQKNCTRYQPQEQGPLNGVSEQHPLEFHSPYGCSKGAADQYILDYARSFGIPAVVFRMSCIYGPHQMGTEDQGWIAHFLIQALKEEAITICGDGFQVRDVLFIEDLIDAFLLAQKDIHKVSGEAFNIGGGPTNSLSLVELLDLIGSLQQHPVKTRLDDWRIGDQRYYISDTHKFRTATGWLPKISAREGVRRLYTWLLEQREPPAHSVVGGSHAVLTH